jgi:signal transduction histidine kinase
MIILSLGQFKGFRPWVLFWPTLIFIEYLHILFLESFRPERSRGDSVSPSKKVFLYFGLGLTLSLCSFDHIPEFGFVLPAVGNILFTIFLFFSSQVIVPEKLFGIEALASRFFAVLILSLILTGFFALLFPYISSSFALFLLNSFLISFAVLALWSPLVTFFRYLGRGLFRTQSKIREQRLDWFRNQVSAVTGIQELLGISRDFMEKQFNTAGVEFQFGSEGKTLPDFVLAYFQVMDEQKLSPILYREILAREREQVLTRDRKRELERLLRFLKVHQCDAVYPIQHEGRQVGWVQINQAKGEALSGFPRLNETLEALELLARNISRILQFEAARERDRLILLGEMAAGLAHEVRNPLGAIRGAADLIDASSGPWVAVIREEVDRLNRLVSQFLDFSHEQSENRDRVDLNEVIPKILAPFRLTMDSSIELEWSPRASPVRILLVPDSLQQVLQNLLQNSVKALQGRPFPKVTVRVLDSGFSVTDNGMGMSAEVVSKVFQPFFTSFSNGTGLGLSICEKLVRFDHGKMQVLSVQNEGTEVRVEYPDAR